MTSLQPAPGFQDHLVQFYEEDAFLLDQVSDFIGAGLETGQAGIVIATRQHRVDLEPRLTARGAFPLDADAFLVLDAEETLAKFMVDDWPDERLFEALLGDFIRRAARNGTRQVRAFGEMVALLWAEGKHEAAVRLEELWNDLARSHSFSLLCAYPMASFRNEAHGNLFLHVCNAHSQVRPAESFVDTADTDELNRQIALLQRKAAAFEAEVEKRKESERRKDEFLAMLGHELRNPLAAIVNAVELMRLSENPVHLARARDIVARQATTMSRLVDDLLDVSRIARGKIQLRTGTVLLGTWVEQAVELVRPLIDERNHLLSVEIPTEPVCLFGDGARLVQILTNLLNNAAKYTHPGGNIWLTAHQAGRDLLLRVRDDGVGLTPELRERIFEPFVQAPDSREHARGGLGIGLTLVRSLVELHGGSVEARSDGPGRGSEFAIRLPLSPASA